MDEYGKRYTEEELDAMFPIEVGLQALRERKQMIPKGDPVLCVHANEAPMFCPCDKDCYCQTHTCKNKCMNCGTLIVVTEHHISGHLGGYACAKKPKLPEENALSKWLKS